MGSLCRKRGIILSIVEDQLGEPSEKELVRGCKNMKLKSKLSCFFRGEFKGLELEDRCITSD